MARQGIQTAYESASKDISNLIGLFEVELDKSRQPATAYDLTEINRARQLMIQALSAMSGTNVGDIKLALDDMNLNS